MNSRFVVMASGMVVAVAVAVFWAAFLRGSSPTQSQSPPPSTLCCTPTWVPPALQTLAQGTLPPIATPRPRIISTAEEALRLAAPRFVGGRGGLGLAHPASVSYAETTVGEALKLLQPSGPRQAPEVPDNAAAWVFIAYGQFAPEHSFAIGGFVNETFTPVPPPTATAAWVIVPKDGAGGGRLLFGYSDQNYDLAQLGTPVAVPAQTLEQLCDEFLGPSDSARAQLC